MVLDALKAARPSMGELAERSGIPLRTLYSYSSEQRTPNARALRKLARALRKQSAELVGHAAALDALADQDTTP